MRTDSRSTRPRIRLLIDARWITLSFAITAIAAVLPASAQVLYEPVPIENVDALRYVGEPVSGGEVQINVAAPEGSRVLLGITGAPAQLFTRHGLILVDPSSRRSGLRRTVADESGARFKLRVPSLDPGRGFCSC